MNKIAVTGANGFVGSNLVRKLMKNGHQVKCLVRAGSDLSLLPENADIYKIDYHDLKEIAEVLHDCEIIIHNAALTRAKSWKAFQKINVNLTETLTQIAANNINTKRFIFISSQAAAGPASGPDDPVQENDDPHPVSWYGKSKLLAEQAVKNSRLPFTIIRPVSVFGPGDKDFLEYFRMIKNHLAAFIGFKSKFISLVFVEDLVEIIYRSLENKQTENEILFAASTPQISMQEFVNTLKKIMHSKTIDLHLPHFLIDIAALFSELASFFSIKPPILNKQKAKEFKQRYWLVDDTKMKNLLSFEPELTLQEQIKKTFEWYKNKGWL
ncbi:MAG: NAD-dependent epimerase/dehydratase family protein [Candidatus Cloacimonetes bacterium]|nr:NAD-dependent epimerase/dehydratase family protein [Candidatus Cloacimonadota bacterium]MCF7813536.1 NAD-dependent epimerase/dehydratase family protein [Candidatus Cloacimonadota bacterium]MCF7868680.1 NAD-dependent epimerase/dehydratase family protein [Candidatus Cloacimonadota bacterium]MCF7884190.1 NAD-dependent epimerase/dehydratase family protein [Candidatus Cloacimonadota bacterium]